MDRRVNDIQSLIDFLNDKEKGIEYIYPELSNQINNSFYYLFGHSFGGGTISTISAKNDKIRKIVCLDSWMFPMRNNYRTTGSLKSDVLNLSADLWQFGKV